MTLGTGDGFWSSRTTKPTIIEFPSGKKFTNIAYDVDLKYNPGAWSDFMNNYAISPIPPSSVQGSDGAGKTFHITWEVNFELDGDYKKFQKYFIPNINKTLSNISGIYSNNKYSN